MPGLYEGKLDGQGLKLGIVVSRFNEFIAHKLLDGAIDVLRRHNVSDEDIDVAWVPGSFEIPLVARRLAEKGTYHAVVCLGVVIRGDTPHFEYVSSEAAKGIARAGFDTNLPIIFGLITAETIEQAIERAGTKAGNKGWDAALSAIEMANLMRALD